MRQIYFFSLIMLTCTNASARGYHKHINYPDWFLFIFLVFMLILSACSSYNGWKKRDFVHLGLALLLFIALCWFLIAGLSKVNWSSVWDMMFAISAMGIGWMAIGASLCLMGWVLKTIVRIIFKG